MSVLGCLVLTVHGLPVEVAVAKKAGVNVWIVLVTRVGGGVLFAWVFGIGKEATSFAIIGITLGLSFGGGLIINEAKKGEIPAKDVFSTIILLSLLHSLIEDTMLIMLLGADFTSIFWGRLIFVTLFVGIFLRLVDLMSEESRQRYFYRSLKDEGHEVSKQT